MQKRFNYNKRSFTITVNLNALVEKRMRGRRTHHVIVKEIGGFMDGMDYKKEYDIDSQSLLEDSMLKIESDIMKYVDMPKFSPEEQKLLDLGYELPCSG